jgi:hypothetical protein
MSESTIACMNCPKKNDDALPLVRVDVVLK